MKKIKNMDAEWSYTSSDEPEHWYTLCDRFVEGAKFAYQSPITLGEESAEIVDSQITFHYKKGEFTEEELKNTFHSAPPNTESYVMFENVAHHLTDIHFHMSSEHLLSGKQYPLEFHLARMNDAGENLVVGYLLTITEEENRFSEVSHPMDWENGMHQQWFGPSIFLPEERLHYHYIGSLTALPTKGPMKWFVPDITQKMDQALSNKTKEGMLAFNNWSLQPLNGRKIYSSND